MQKHYKQGCYLCRVEEVVKLANLVTETFGTLQFSTEKKLGHNKISYYQIGENIMDVNIGGQSVREA